MWSLDSLGCCLDTGRRRIFSLLSKKKKNSPTNQHNFFFLLETWFPCFHGNLRLYEDYTCVIIFGGISNRIKTKLLLLLRVFLHHPISSGELSHTFNKMAVLCPNYCSRFFFFVEVFIENVHFISMLFTCKSGLSFSTKQTAVSGKPASKC